jgi:hypothetical protein
MTKARAYAVFVFFAIFCLSPFPVAAARFSGDYLLYVCGSDKNGKELVAGGHAVCQAYIAGILDYHNLIRSLGTAPGVDFCVPEGVDLYDLQRKVQSYVFKNRNLHSKFVASPGVALGLYAAYPCKK